MPYDKDGKYYRLPTNSINKKKDQPKKENVDNKKPKEDWFGSIILFTVLIAVVGGCVAYLNKPKEEIKKVCIKTVAMDSRETFDDEKFLIRVFDESYKGRGQIVNVETEEVFLVIFNNTIKSDGERNYFNSVPRSPEEVTQAKLNDGRVLFFEASCIKE